MELEEAKRAKDFLSKKLNENEKICERLGEEFVLLREELEQLKLNIHKGIESLYHILSMKISPLIKSYLVHQKSSHSQEN